MVRCLSLWESCSCFPVTWIFGTPNTRLCSLIVVYRWIAIDQCSNLAPIFHLTDRYHFWTILHSEFLPVFLNLARCAKVGGFSDGQVECLRYSESWRLLTSAAFAIPANLKVESSRTPGRNPVVSACGPDCQIWTRSAPRKAVCVVLHRHLGSAHVLYKKRVVASLALMEVVVERL